MDESLVPDLEQLETIEENERITAIVITILVIGVIVIFSIAFYFRVNESNDYDKDSPNIETECYLSQHGDYIVEITNIDQDNWQVTSYYYQLYNPGGYYIPRIRGPLEEIYCLDLQFSPQQYSQLEITFIDHDIDGKLSRGDYFIILSEANGGAVEEGGKLVLRGSYNWGTLHNQELSSQIPKDFPYPQTKLSVTNIDSTNISFDHPVGFFSHWNTVEQSYSDYNITFSYIGDGDRNISLDILVNGKLKESQMITARSGENISFTGEFYSYFRHDQTNTSYFQNLTVVMFATDTNQTLLTGYYGYRSMKLSSVSPSFQHPPLLQFVTFVFLFSMFSSFHRKNNFISRKHK
jgi:hypothetical protein